MVNLSIRGVLVLTVGGLTAVIAFLAASDLLENWQKQRKIDALREASLLSDNLFDATDKLSVERDIALSMLQADPETAKELASGLHEARAGADSAVQMSVERLKTYPFPELLDLRSALLAHLARVKALRGEIDRQAAAGSSQTGKELADEWSTAVSTAMAEADRLWVRFVKHFTGIDPVVTQHLRVKHLLRQIIENSARERLLIGQLVTENKAPTAEQTAQLLRGEGEMDLAWRMSHVIADQSGLLDLVAKKFDDAQSHYATMHEMIQDLFFVPGVSREQPYPISAPLWFELSTEATESLLALRDATIDASRRENAQLTAEARRAIAFWFVVLLTALALCAYCFWLVFARVLTPINKMIEALLAATRGEVVEFAGADNRHDEIGKLADVLHAFHKNVEDIKDAALKVERSESLLQAVVDHTADGMITIDAVGKIVSFNPACERLFGYTADEAVGQDVRVLVTDAGHATLNAYFLTCLETASGRGHVLPSRDLLAKRKNGATFPIELSLSAYRFDGRQKFSAIVRDVTTRKQAEHDLLQHTRALERSNKELDDFAYIASHDLKEPLRGIHNHARFLLEDNTEKLDEESVGRLGRLVFLSQRMERLVNDLLYFSRLGRQELAIQQTDIAGVIADIESTLDHFLAEHRAKIVVGTALPQVVCDKPRVTELLRNLITNAVKYNDGAEKIVEIGRKPEHPLPGGGTARNVFYVKDNGRGIDREFHTEIFRIFKRLQAASEKEEGTGVGLTFVKKIVERHGGHIWLESELGKGTTFFFTLEATRDEPDFGAEAAA